MLNRLHGFLYQDQPQGLSYAQVFRPSALIRAISRGNDYRPLELGKGSLFGVFGFGSR